MKQKRYSNIIGFDDAPFSHDGYEAVKVVGAVYAGLRLDGVIIGEVERDGIDAAIKLEKMITESKFAEHARLIMLQGISFGGFNVVDIFYLHESLGLPILVVSRNQPDMESIRDALVTRVPDGEKKWGIIERLGQMEPLGKIFIQRVGLGFEDSAEIVEQLSVNSHIPEPIRTAHLIAGALVKGQSRGRP